MNQDEVERCIDGWNDKSKGRIVEVWLFNVSGDQDERIDSAGQIDRLTEILSTINIVSVYASQSPLALNVLTKLRRSLRDTPCYICSRLSDTHPELVECVSFISELQKNHLIGELKKPRKSEKLMECMESGFVGVEPEVGDTKEVADYYRGVHTRYAVLRFPRTVRAWFYDNEAFLRNKVEKNSNSSNFHSNVNPLRLLDKNVTQYAKECSGDQTHRILLLTHSNIIKATLQLSLQRHLGNRFRSRSLTIYSLYSRYPSNSDLTDFHSFLHAHEGKEEMENGFFEDETETTMSSETSKRKDDEQTKFEWEEGGKVRLAPTLPHSIVKKNGKSGDARPRKLNFGMELPSCDIPSAWVLSSCLSWLHVFNDNTY